MTTQPRERRPAFNRIAQNNARFFAGIILFVALLAFYAFHHPVDALHRRAAERQTLIIGRAWIIDGDTIAISGRHIRLEGIDAPESDQTCTDSKGKTWPCGRTATSELRAHIRGQQVTCRWTALDRYRRVLGVCTLPDGSDISAWMVRQGWALAYGFAKTYAHEEAEAQAAGRGIWAGRFVPPWRWRHGQ
jgi:endonuclease YncB( thermonuclease family)